MLIKKSFPSKGIFVTGTDTGVGKTYVSCLLARALSSGRRVAVFKPYLTGSRADARALLGAARSGQSLDDINPYFFKNPLAPLVAARLEKKRISVGKTLAAFKKIRSLADFIIVEGAGGLFVPIKDNFNMMDLMKALGLPVVLVSRAGLGAINHTLLSVEALDKRKIKLSAVALNGYTGRDLAQKTNPAVIKKYVRVPVFIVAKNASRPPKGLIRCLLKKD